MAEKRYSIVTSTVIHPICDARILYREARALAGAGYAVEVAGLPPAPHDSVDGIRLTILPRARSRAARLALSGARLIPMLIRRRASVYHFHDPELLWVALVLRLIGRRVIYDAHEDLPRQILDKPWIPHWLRRPLAGVSGALLKLTSRALHGVVAATDGVAKGLRGRVVVVRNFPDLALFRKRVERGDGRTELIYVGGVSFSRGVREMTSAAASVPNVRLHLIGTIAGTAEREFLAQQEPERIVHEAWMEPLAVYERLAAADIGLVVLHDTPRYRDALPVKLFEYMAAGLPVIASDFPLWREIVAGAGAGLLVDPQDPEAIAAAIDRLAADPKLRRTMGENARKAAVEKYNWATEAEKLLALYREVLGEKRAVSWQRRSGSLWAAERPCEGSLTDAVTSAARQPLTSIAQTKKPKLWLVNHYGQAPCQPGGTRHYELARRLVERGWDVTLIASEFQHATRSRAGGVGTGRFTAEPLDGIRFVRVRSTIGYSGNGLARIANMSEFAVRMTRLGRTRFDGTVARPDVIVGSSPHLFAAWAAKRLARKWHIPFVFEVRDLWPESLVALRVMGRRHPVVVALRWLERSLYRSADAIVSLLPDAWRYIVGGADVPQEAITWISNGATLAGPWAPAEESGPLTVMYLGAHGRANALDDLLAAAGFLQKTQTAVRFVLIGEGPEKPRLEARARAEGLANVTFRPPVPKTAVPETLAHAGVLVALLEDTPLYQYGISLNKLFDYMAAGRPIVLAGRTAHNYVELARCGLTMPPRDPEALAGALAQLAAMSAEERQAMGERGRAYVAAHHDWDLLAERFADVLEGVLARGGRS